MSILPVYATSFFASEKRPDGMQLVIRYEDGVIYTNVNLDGRFEGYKGVLHGGMVFGILDVLLWYSILMETRKICMTRKTEMEFLKPVLCNTPYRAEARVIAVEERDIIAFAWIQDEHGEHCAEVKAIFREAKGIDMAQLVESFDFSKSTPDMKEFFYSLIPEKER